MLQEDNNRYTQKLIDYIRGRYTIVVNSKQAEQFLDPMANLCLVLNKK